MALDPDELHWFVLRDGRFERQPPGDDGIYRSEVFPGLWLDPSALFADDLERLVAVVDLGVATPEHAAFVARLDEQRRRSLHECHRTRAGVAVPPLAAGDRLDAATFHERYDAMPPSTRAELIGGVVHMPSPLHRDHGAEGFAVGAWLGFYAARTPGVGGADNARPGSTPGAKSSPTSASASAPNRGANPARPASSSSAHRS